MPGHAHLLPAQQATVNLVGNAAFVAVSLPVSALHGFDDDGDQQLSQHELQRHQDRLRQQVDAGLMLASAQGLAQTVRVDLVLSAGHNDRPDLGNQLLVLKHVRFDTVAQTVTLRNALWGKDESERRIMVKATRNPEAEAAQLTPERPQFVFFRTAPQALWDHVVSGAEHVLLGADHLLFLLTIWVGGVGWRYGLQVVTAFTVAHSLTLGLASLGWIHAAPHWVEPLIAASIVVMALDRLWRAQRVAWQTIGLVFACGLLHGLGFASALTDLGLDDRHLVIGLLGFNLGIELGQALFWFAVAVLWHLVRWRWPGFDEGRFARVLCGAAACIGLYWLIERLYQ